MAGIAEEVMIALALRKPIYVLGGAGGAAQAVGKILGGTIKVGDPVFVLRHAEGGKKVRAKVVGDGVHTLAELALADTGPMAHIADHKKDAWLASIEDAAHQVVPAGETAALEWRHNLAYGAQPEVITPDRPVYASLTDIALRATQVMSLGFCTVDILQSQSGELKVLEVNSGVSVEKFAEVMGDEGLKTAKAVYQQALKALVAQA
jgi:hypothetical protein